MMMMMMIHPQSHPGPRPGTAGLGWIDYGTVFQITSGQLANRSRAQGSSRKQERCLLPVEAVQVGPWTLTLQEHLTSSSSPDQASPLLV